MSMIEAFLANYFKSSTDKSSPVKRYYLWSGFGMALFAHHIMRSDDAGVYHSHPWNGVSIIFGSYREQFIGCEPKRRFLLNLVSAKTPHRVVTERPVWTLFFHTKRINTWGMFDSFGKSISSEPWRGPNKLPNNP